MRNLMMVVFVLAIGTSVGAYAFNTRFLRDAPITLFSKQDLQLFQQTVMRSLAHNADGQTTRWSSATTDSNGEITPLDTRTVDKTTCRRTRIVNRAQGRDGHGVYEFCQQPDGDWKIGRPVRD